jgi:hypothetical protein
MATVAPPDLFILHFQEIPMSNRIVTQLTAIFQRTHGYYLQFVDQCPDELWVKKFGSWPIWQHIVHVYYCIDYQVLQEGQDPTPWPCKAASILAFDFDIGAMVDKAAMPPYMLTMKAKADAYIDSLTDAMLGATNAGYASRKIHSMGATQTKEDCTHALTLSVMATHAFYHFGVLDAALRDHGCKGIY